MHGYGRKFVNEGDEIVVSEMEHHSNLVPWQMLCEEKGARLRVIPMDDAGELLLDEFDALLNERTKLVCVGHVSNALGTVNPVKEITARAPCPVLDGFGSLGGPLMRRIARGPVEVDAAGPMAGGRVLRQRAHPASA